MGFFGLSKKAEDGISSVNVCLMAYGLSEERRKEIIDYYGQRLMKASAKRRARRPVKKIESTIDNAVQDEVVSGKNEDALDSQEGFVHKKSPDALITVALSILQHSMKSNKLEVECCSLAELKRLRDDA